MGISAVLAALESLRPLLAAQGFPVNGRVTFQLACYPVRLQISPFIPRGEIAIVDATISTDTGTHQHCHIHHSLSQVSKLGGFGSGDTSEFAMYCFIGIVACLPL